MKEIEKKMMNCGINKEIVIAMDEENYKALTTSFLKAQKTAQASIMVASMISVMNGWRS